MNIRATTQSSEAKQELTVQQTLQKMQSDLASTGTVRPEDLLKVLGDPTKSVKVTLPASFPNITSKRV